MSIRKNIRYFRLMHGMTQLELGNRVGVSESMICQLERGIRSLSVPLGKEIAKALNCSLEDLAE